MLEIINYMLKLFHDMYISGILEFLICTFIIHKIVKRPGIWTSTHVRVLIGIGLYEVDVAVVE